MTDLDASMYEPVELPHEFVIELNSLVVVNHKLTLEAIDKDEEAELAKVGGSDDPDTLRSIENGIQTFYEDLRRAANNMAAVVLVIRTQ